MNAPSASLVPHRRQSRAAGGFTLVETSVALTVMVALGVAMLLMLQQHIAFMNLTRQQGFLTSDAPHVGHLVGRLFGKADHFFVYNSRAAALAGAAPILVNGSAARLFFEAANGETREQWITAEPAAGGTALVCRSARLDGTEFSWTVCSGLAGASFHSLEGVLGVTLNGANGEVISYYGGSQ
ncbi:MAG: hypothetical protein ACAI34_02170 [Verrucomicrobium sp.]|nr:hypothetical protein [Verrucomicrobium sp.]